MAVMIVWPRFKWGRHLPGSLVGIILATLIVLVSGWDVPTIGAIRAAFCSKTASVLPLFPGRIWMRW